MRRAYVDAKAEIEKQPNDDDRRERASDLGCSQGLNQKKADQDGASSPNNGG